MSELKKYKSEPENLGSKVKNSSQDNNKTKIPKGSPQIGEYYAYIVIVPDPHKSKGIKRKNNDDYGEYLFWFKIGDTNDVSSRVRKYQNPSQYIAVIKFTDTPQVKSPGKRLEEHLLSEHERGGMLPGLSSEWRALYVSEANREGLVEDLKNMLRFFGTPDDFKKKSVKGCLYANIMGRIANGIQKATKGPGKNVNQKPKGCQMLSVIVTPSIHQDAQNRGFERTDEEQETNDQVYKYWLKIEYTCTTNTTTYSLFSSKYATETPDFAYNAYHLGKVDEGMGRDLARKAREEFVKGLKWIDPSLDLRTVHQSAERKNENPWYYITFNKRAPAARTYLRKFVESFDKKNWVEAFDPVALGLSGLQVTSYDIPVERQGGSMEQYN